MRAGVRGGKEGCDGGGTIPGPTSTPGCAERFLRPQGEGVPYPSPRPEQHLELGRRRWDGAAVSLEEVQGKRCGSTWMGFFQRWERDLKKPFN